MIILCHYLQYYENELAWWFNVGVQIFFVVSGYLYGGKTIEKPIEFELKRFQKILVPYYSFFVACLFLYILFARDTFSIFSAIGSVFCVDVVKGIEHLWFVGYILFCYILTPYLYMLKKHIKAKPLFAEIFVWCTVLFLFCVVGEFTDAYFNPERICCYICGYAIASIKEHFGKKSLNPIAIIISVSAISMNTVKIICKYCYNFENDTMIMRVINLFDGYIHMLLGLALFFLLYAVFRKAKPNRLLNFSDKYSYHIYLVHQLFILSPFSLLTLTKYSTLNLTISFVSILLTAMLLYFISNKIEKRIFKKGV